MSTGQTRLAVSSDLIALAPSAAQFGEDRITALLAKASARLRQRLPSVDDRIECFETDPDDPRGLDPVLVADVVATAVKRFLDNPTGATNTSETAGPFSKSTGFALRGDKDIRGEIVITDDDLKALKVAQLRPMMGTARTRPRLARWPYGDAGNPALANSPYPADSLLLGEGLSDPAGEFGPIICHNPAD